MKNFNTYAYLLFLAIITGAFASFAQNSYGLKITGLACIGFSLLFFIDAINNRNTSVYQKLQGGLLGVLAFLFFLRSYYIRFEGIELVVSIVGIGLAIVTILIFSNIRKTHPKLAIITTNYSISISLFFISLAITPFYYMGGQVIGGISAVFLGIVAILISRNRKVEVQNEEVKSFSYVLSIDRNSVVVVVTFVLFSVYIGMSGLNLIPEMYTSTKPPKYVKLVKQAETGNEQPQNGRYKHEIFQQYYEEVFGEYQLDE